MTLFISEYVEGSSFNKALELYNNGDTPVDLSGFELRLYSNGASSPSQTLGLSGTLAAGATYVIANPSANAAILAVADLQNGSVINFNGDDAIELYDVGAGQPVDVFGQIGVDPGSAWTGNGVSTLNSALRRLPSVQQGDPDGSDAFDPSVEWAAFAQDTFDGLGTHTVDGGADTAPVLLTVAPGDGATEVAPDSNVVLQFDEPVDVAGTITIVGDGSASYAFTVLDDTSGSSILTLDPTTEFALGDTITVTVPAGAVTDEDTNDPPDANQTETTVSFTVATSTPLPTLISEVQGNGESSPLIGQQITIEGIVVGDFQDGVSGTNGDFNGFYVQEEDADVDGDDATSEGIFVFDGSLPDIDVNVGDKVRVTGTVTEFFRETQLGGGPTVQIVSSGNTLPTAAQITFPVAQTTTNSDGALIADLEAFEGMLVTIPQELTVADLFTLGRFGDIGLYAEGRLETFTQSNQPSVTGFEAFQDVAVRNTVILDDGSTIQNPPTIPFDVASAPGDVAGQLDANDELRAGDTITDLTGTLRFSRGSGGSGDEIYRINPTVTPVFDNENPRPDEAPDVGGDLKVASFNVLNFFTSLGDGGLTSGPEGQSPRGADNQEEFDRQVAKLVAAVTEIEADVFGLIELENEFGDENGDGRFAIQFLVDELNSAIAGADYQYVDPGTPFIGTDAITVGLIYDANEVGVAPSTTVEVLTDADLAVLGVDPGNPVFDGVGTSRNPLAVTFEQLASGETFTVAVNHFKSKGFVSPFGNNQGIGDGTGNNNEARLQAATALDAWLDTDPTGSGDEDFLIIGDLNAYAMEDPIQYLINQGYEDQVGRFLGSGPDEFAYSFGFPLDLDTSPQVQAFGTLDYALATSSLADQITGATEWHINADEASVFDYNTNFKPQEQVEGLFAANPFRASDHDPVIVGLQLSTPNQPPVAVADLVSVDEEAVVTGNVLDNDTDPDDDTLTASLVTGPGNGELTLNPDGSFEYLARADAFDLATPGETVTETFVYEASDGELATEAEVTINVKILDEGMVVTAARGRGPALVTGTDGGEDRLEGGNGPNEIRGLGGADMLFGGNGPDSIFGGEGIDMLNGGNGPDLLDGGPGDDRLTGGRGPDIFVLAPGEGTDTITDFVAGQDTIGLRDLEFADLTFSASNILFDAEVLATLSSVDATTLDASNFAENFTLV